jgi:signal recognition particle GTPase
MNERETAEKVQDMRHKLVAMDYALDFVRLYLRVDPKIKNADVISIVAAFGTALDKIDKDKAELLAALKDAKAMLDKLGNFEGMQAVGKTTRYTRICKAIKKHET